MIPFFSQAKWNFSLYLIFFTGHLGGYFLATVKSCLRHLWRSRQGRAELEFAYLTGAPGNHNRGFKAGTHQRVKEDSPCLPAAGYWQLLRHLRSGSRGRGRGGGVVHEKFYCCFQSSNHEELSPAYMSWEYISRWNQRLQGIKLWEELLHLNTFILKCQTNKSESLRINCHPFLLSFRGSRQQTENKVCK